MKNNHSQMRLLVIMLVTFFITAPAFALGLDQGKVTKISGSAMFKKVGSADWSPLQIGAILSEGDALKTTGQPFPIALFE